ncbi:LAFE_0H17854g1_1 [Lachancea fermentati]|uniref:LAFE_0H17854g1_1 n=1 Tax=Lachancea fermentati TaxID=4955 RepID=A0A1G4MLB1_LACFM|nr:LAFE_0H17854g1_1 [Lachancea fermentati]
MQNRKLLIGIDIGGTNSDLVVIEPSRLEEQDRGVITWHKAVTTPNVSIGIENCIRTVLDDAIHRISKEEIISITIGTTHLINAVVERDESKLEKVAVLRLSGPYGKDLPPFGDFPNDLAEIIYGYSATIGGGFQVDGQEITELDEAEVRKHCAVIKDLGIYSVAVVGTFSNICNSQELRTAEIIQEEIPEVNIVLSHCISGIGFVERENASILNAAIKSFACKIIYSFVDMTKKLGLNCNILLSQNDGTVLSLKEALEVPIRTFSSGSTNSMRGASILCSSDPEVKGKTVIVCDVGGTTSDVGQLLASGFPRQSSTYSYVGGVRMNFSMPLVESIGLGGGSIVRTSSNTLTVGPDSLGAEIVDKSLLFGGDTITTSDITIARFVDERGMESTENLYKIGDPSKVCGKFSPDIKSQFSFTLKKKFEAVIDRIKTSPQPIPVIFVGGGSFIAPDSLEGVSKVIKPPFFQIANAIGAALGKISAYVTEVKTLQNPQTEIQDTIDKLIKKATEKAIKKGAKAITVEVVNVVSDAIPYVDKVYNFEVKVVGDFDFDHIFNNFEDIPKNLLLRRNNLPIRGPQKCTKLVRLDPPIFDYAKYEPKVTDGKWVLSEVDIDFISVGAYILGCGGGGDPNAQTIELKALIRSGTEIVVLTLEDFMKYVGKSGRAINVGYMGSPTISGERLHGNELLEAVELIERWEGRKTNGIFPFEIGGGNGLSGIWTAAKRNLPCIDLDLMGRAYPTQWQTLPSVIHDYKGYPYVALSDGNGMSMIVTRSKDDVYLESIIRDVMYNHGVQCACVEPSMDVEQMEKETIANPISLAWRIGREVLIARNSSDLESIPKRITEAVGGDIAAKCLFKGKIISVEKKLERGYGYGVVELESLGKKSIIRIPFKNENIVVYEVGKDGEEIPICTVPDLITLIDMDGRAVGTQDYRYGLIVFVMAFAPSEKWSTEKGIEIGGPKGFGEAFDQLEYRPIGEYVRPVSVSEQYNCTYN